MYLGLNKNKATSHTWFTVPKHTVTYSNLYNWSLAMLNEFSFIKMTISCKTDQTGAVNISTEARNKFFAKCKRPIWKFNGKHLCFTSIECTTQNTVDTNTDKLMHVAVSKWNKLKREKRSWTQGSQSPENTAASYQMWLVLWLAERKPVQQDC